MMLVVLVVSFIAMMVIFLAANYMAFSSGYDRGYEQGRRDMAKGPL